MGREYYQPGKTYEILTLKTGEEIPCGNARGDTLTINYFHFIGDLPLLLDMSYDEEFNVLMETVLHSHIDWRFVPPEFFDWYKAQGFNDAAPVFRHILKFKENEGVKYLKPLKKSMLCYRTARQCGMPNYRDPNTLPLLRVIEKQHCKALMQGRCPHRGTRQEAMVKRGDTLTCPAHGLRWSESTGEMRRYR